MVLNELVSITRDGVEDARLEAKAKDTKKSEVKDTPSEDRPSRGQGQKCSRPWTKDTSRKCSPKKKVFAQKIRKLFAKFRRSPKKEGLRSKILKFSSKFKRFSKKKRSLKIFSQVLWRAPKRNNIAHNLGSFSTSQKIVLSSSRGQDIFEDLTKDFKASRPRPSVLEDVLEAKDVLKDSTSINYSCEVTIAKRSFYFAS